MSKANSKARFAGTRRRTMHAHTSCMSLVEMKTVRSSSPSSGRSENSLRSVDVPAFGCGAAAASASVRGKSNQTVSSDTTDSAAAASKALMSW